MTFNETLSSGVNSGLVSVAKLLQNIPVTQSVKTGSHGSPFFKPLAVEPGFYLHPLEANTGSTNPSTGPCY